jgi:phage/plasmid-like protein (TIGR03299 family)
MSSFFDPGQGFFVRTPSWHRLESKVLEDWPGTWPEARELAGLLWEPQPEPLYRQVGTLSLDGTGLFGDVPRFEKVTGHQAITRTDTGALLGVQTSAYRVIDNTALGEVIETVMGVDPFGDRLKYEGVFSLHGGKLVLAVLYNQSAFRIGDDPSETVNYTVVCSRHDGQGGLKVIKTNIRVVCANTWGMAEHSGVDEQTSFVIRHTENWDERVAEVRDALQVADLANEAYANVCEQLMLKKTTNAHRDRFLEKFLPVGSDMGERQKANRYDERAQVRMLLEGPTCEGIDKTAYGLLQAAGEWADHYRRFRSVDTYVTRNLTTKEPMKARAFRLTKEMAGIR